MKINCVPDCVNKIKMRTLIPTGNRFLKVFCKNNVKC